MKSSGKPSRRKKAVGSIIGAVFLVLIILSGFTFYQLYLNIADHYNGSLQSMGESDWSRNREKIVIKNVEITGSGNLSVTVENGGTLQSHLIWFGIFNMSALPETQAYYPLDISVDPAETKSVVSVFTVTQGSKYAVQLVTELGNTIGFKFYPASEVRCALSLTVAPVTTYDGNNVTVMLTVTHNDTEVDAIQSLTASINVAPEDPLVQRVDNSSLTVTGLARGGSVFFWWVYNMNRTGTVTFNATYSSAPAGTYALTKVNILARARVSISGVNGTAEYNPSQWNPLGSTQNVNGSIPDLTNDDTNYVFFGSYHTGSAVNVTALDDGFEASPVWDANWNQHGTTDWNNDAAQKHSGSRSASGGSSDTNLTSDDIDTSGVTCFYVEFWYRNHLTESGDFILYYWDGSQYDLIQDLGALDPEDTWFKYGQNVSDSQYFRSDFHIRFNCAPMEGSETVWVDDVLVTNQGTNEQTAEVEFTGSSNPLTWTQLVWQIDSAWNTGQVTVTIQFFNFTSGDFAPSGNGYISYISSATPNIDELKSQSIDLNPNDFKNSTEYWRVKIKGVKTTSAQFLMKIDWVDFETTYSSAGDSIPYNVWQWYTIRATSASGGPIPYAYASIYANATLVYFRNATDKVDIGNPAWVRLDANGQFMLEIKSASGSAETFVLYAVVGSTVSQETVTQEAP